MKRVTCENNYIYIYIYLFSFNHEVADSIPGTSTIIVEIKSGIGYSQPREDKWLAT
jgi:hypothetical protein